MTRHGNMSAGNWPHGAGSAGESTTSMRPSLFKLTSTTALISCCRFFPSDRDGKRLWISQTTLNRLESVGQNTTLNTLNQLCQSLGSQIGDLFEAGRVRFGHLEARRGVPPRSVGRRAAAA